jgi:hypothetical protein
MREPYRRDRTLDVVCVMNGVPVVVNGQRDGAALHERSAARMKRCAHPTTLTAVPFSLARLPLGPARMHWR